MTVLGPDFVALQVRDLAASATWYETHLGLQRAPQGPPGAVVFTTSPVAFAVREPLPGTDLDAITPRPGAGVALWLATDDADALHDRLREAGADIVAPPADGPFGLFFSVADPDGYVLTLHQR
jgi:predicted enzyme related to lactoylglutathione lyase